jgi:hypothetical protein
MMRLVGLALALTLVGASAASAQILELNLDRGQELGFEGENSSQHQVDRTRRGDRIIVRRQHDALETGGGINCRTTVVRRMNDDGDIVMRRIRKCD